jgi:hypothetical protein
LSYVPGRSSRNLARAAIALVALGAVLRLIKFLDRPGLWVDEAMIALNIGRRSYGGLLHTLDFTQLAPVPWLWLEKLLVDLAGMHELVLRAPALVAGILVPWLVWRAGLHLVGEWGAVVATSLTATGSALLFFSAETKPYSTDAAIAALLLLLVGRVLTRPIGDRSLRVLGVAGVLALLSSFPSVFVLGGIGIALLVRAAIARHAASLRAVVAWGVVWVLTFALPQLLLYRDMGTSEGMQTFWKPAMARLGEPGAIERASRAVNALLLTLTGQEVWPGSELFLLVFALGAWAIARKRGVVTMLTVTAPLMLLGTAWLLDQIPANDRLLLFAAPILALLSGAAVAELMHRIPYRVRKLGALPILILLIWVAQDEIRSGMRREKSSGGRELVARIQGEPAAPVWLTRWGMPVWVYYTTDWTAPDTVRIDWYAGQTKDGWLGTTIPVFDDGESRLHRWNGRVERISGPSGIKSEAGGLRDLGSGDDWARNEARLIASLADARPWILMIHEKPPEHSAIVQAIQASAMTLDSVAAEKRSTLWRVGPTSAQAPSATSTSSIEPQR